MRERDTQDAIAFEEQVIEADKNTETEQNGSCGSCGGGCSCAGGSCGCNSGGSCH